jgi:hypothetical protein
MAAANFDIIFVKKVISLKLINKNYFYLFGTSFVLHVLILFIPFL